MTSTTTSETSDREGTFAARLSPPAHVMSFFENDQHFYDIVSDFVASGLAAGDPVIVVATSAHLRDLEDQYVRRGIFVDGARREGRYTEHDSNDVYESLLSMGWPEEDCFEAVVGEAFRHGRLPGRTVRGVGEVVAVTWGPRADDAMRSRDSYLATLRFEQRQQELVAAERMVTLCLYPRSAFERDRAFDLRGLAAAHTSLRD